MKKDHTSKTEDELLEELKSLVKDLQNRKKYRDLNPEILATIPDDRLVLAIYDFADAAINEDSENATGKVPALGPGFSAVYFVRKLDVEVSNGGFDQFYGHEGRRAVELSKEGAELMGLGKLAAVIGKALEIEEKERGKMAKVKEQGAVEAIFESYEDVSFDEADEPFQELDMDLGKEMVAFIRRRPELFVGKLR